MIPAPNYVSTQFNVFENPSQEDQGRITVGTRDRQLLGLTEPERHVQPLLGGRIIVI